MEAFGPYRVGELLGRGGMGEVHRAYDTAHDRVVALKRLSAVHNDDEEFRARFRRESRIAARLREPHVIPIHAYGEIDGRLYLDMRLVEGRDLAELVAGGPLDPARAVRIIAQVAGALDAAHADGLVHRDVKPSNILVTPDDFVYLVDFGIARSVLPAGTHLTASGAVIGTLDYLAPERFGDGVVDVRADVYALACVLYACVTGNRPFEADSAAGLLWAHLQQPPPAASTTNPAVPPALDDVIRHGMAKDPANRYPRATALATAAAEA
ncbi:MAG: serine/threonine protein kinase, partial [Saccharothrix sp.]|nr:serine/threonine protein kinase [Saccharothrix sp.]